MHILSRLLVALLVAVFVLPSSPIPPVSAAPWEEKVDPWVLQSAQAAGDGQVDFLIYLVEQADLRQAATLTSKEEKGDYVFRSLTETARRTQTSLLQELQRQDIPHRSYWIANMVWARGDLQVVQDLARRREVARIHANPQVFSTAAERAAVQQELTSILWNIEKVGAPQVWAAGYQGQGVVVGGQDTGYQWDHPAIKGQYRGWNGVEADHAYSWHDAIRENVGPIGDNHCGFDSSVPCDDNGHGTHTMGTIVGGVDIFGTQIGVAPGARWIGCRNMENGWGTPATYSECYEWFMAPYPPGASSLDGDPSMAPDIINNSWACPPEEGCTEPDVLLAVVDNVRAAGILTVHSAGNSGPNCETVDTPAAIYDSSFTVGNITQNDVIAPSSSRGPVLVDDSGRLKPDISAPGSGIYSSYYSRSLGSIYTTLSGTSMAAPHVAGVAALLLSAQPLLAGQVDLLEQVMTSTAYALTSAQECGGIPGSSIPNNTHGYGRVDAWEALKVLPHGFALTVSTHHPFVLPGGLVRYQVQLTHLHSLYPTENTILIAQFPAGTSVETSSAPYIQFGNSLQWNFASLAANESLLLTVDLRVPDTFAVGTSIESTFSVTSDQVEQPVTRSAAPVVVLLPAFLPLIY
jgi:serine protease AprX